MGYHFTMGPQSFVRRFVCLIRSVAGQRSFYRAVKLLMYEAQFYVLNQPATNGEYYFQAVILRHFANPVVFDIGANVGDWTESLLRQSTAGGVAVHAFEPSSGTFELLQKHAKGWKGVALTQAACSDHVGLGSLAVEGAGSGSNALLNPEFCRRGECGAHYG
jgi:hypothetical protein